jgi:hypothetical protein
MQLPYCTVSQSRHSPQRNPENFPQYTSLDVKARNFTLWAILSATGSYWFPYNLTSGSSILHATISSLTAIPVTGRGGP